MTSTATRTARAREGTIARATAGLVPYAPTVLRLGVGFIFLAAGLIKLPMQAGFAQTLGTMGFPAADFLSWFVILLEIVGGAALIIGLLVRAFALLFAIEMVVTSLVVKLPLGVAPEGQAGIQLDLLVLAASLALVILGPGRLSVDHDVLRRELI